MWLTSALFEGDLSLLRPLIPAWLPQPIASGRVDIWTVEAVLAIAKRLDEMEARDAENERLRAERDAERALADQLADAILSASVEEAIEKTDAALAAHAAARTNGSASATHVGAQP